MVGKAGFRRIRHAGAGLGPEILDDDLLDVAVMVIEVAQREQRLDALAPGLADADQDAGGERHRRLAGRGDRGEPHRRVLVGRAEMRPAATAQPLGGTFEHDPLRGRDRAQCLDIGAAHDAGVQMRQEAGFAQHQPGHLGEIGQRRLVAEASQRVPRRGIAQFGLVAQREESLMTAGGGAGAGDRQHLFGIEINRLARPRRVRKGAIMAHVAA